MANYELTAQKEVDEFVDRPARSIDASIGSCVNVNGM